MVLSSFFLALIVISVLLGSSSLKLSLSEKPLKRLNMKKLPTANSDPLKNIVRQVILRFFATTSMIKVYKKLASVHLHIMQLIVT